MVEQSLDLLMGAYFAEPETLDLVDLALEIAAKSTIRSLID